MRLAVPADPPTRVNTIGELLQSPRLVEHVSDHPDGAGLTAGMLHARPDSRAGGETLVPAALHDGAAG
jgi:hypothetical protein